MIHLMDNDDPPPRERPSHAVLFERVSGCEHLDSEATILCVAFAALCKHDDAVLTQAVLQLAARAGPQRVAQLVRELCLQGIAYCGFPRSLHALFVLAPYVDVGCDLEPNTVQERATAGPQRERGIAHFESIYGDKSQALRAKIRALDPDFEGLVLDVAYGAILAREGIAARTRELLGVAGLAVLGHGAQLASHARGALRHGASLESVAEVLTCVGTFWPETPELEAFHDLVHALRPKTS